MGSVPDILEEKHGVGPSRAGGLQTQTRAPTPERAPVHSGPRPATRDDDELGHDTQVEGPQGLQGQHTGVVRLVERRAGDHQVPEPRGCTQGLDEPLVARGHVKAHAPQKGRWMDWCREG